MLTRATAPVPAQTLQNVSPPCKRHIQEDFRLSFPEDDSMLLCSAHFSQGENATQTLQYVYT